jgi:Tfp pilus assembly protein PilF
MTRISMMMTSTTRSPRRPIARPAIAALAALVVLAVSGCGSPSKQDVVNNAETRWKQMRSTLMLQMAEQQFATGDLDQAERSLRDAMQPCKSTDATPPLASDS